MITPTGGEGAAGFVSGTPKADWASLPPGLCEGVEALLGAPVTAATTTPGGFTPGAAARLVLGDSRRAFVKATTPTLSEPAARMHRREAEVLARLRDVPGVPDLIGTVEDGDWIALVLDDIEGRHPRLPWTVADLDVVLEALAGLHEALTPAPVEAEPMSLGAGSGRGTWETIAEEPGRLAGYDAAWLQGRLDELAALESDLDRAVTGPTLLHADLRADQILLGADQVHVVDWAQACTGPGWVDVALMLPSVGISGGPSPTEVATRSGELADAPEHDLRAVVAALTGFFVHRSTEPPLPALPTIRSFQRAQGEVALSWLRDLLD